MFDFSLLASGFNEIGRLVEERHIGMATRAASKTVQRELRPEEAQTSGEMCLLAHGLDCKRCFP